MQTVIDRRLEKIRRQDMTMGDFRSHMRALGHELAHAVAWNNLKGENVVVVPIIRAGLGMLDGALSVLPEAEVGFLGIERKEDGPLEHHVYYESLPDLAGKIVVILDPMLATGGSVLAAVKRLRDAGADNIVLISALAAPEGVQAIRDADEGIQMVVGKVDKGLDSDFYITPGLGDAGDRLFGVSS